MFCLDACQENHINLVKYLIEEKNCDINQLTTSYETCLHGAILGAIENRFDSSATNQQRYLIVQYLLSKPDCNPNLGMNFILIKTQEDSFFILKLGLNPLCVSLAHDNMYDYTSLLLQNNCDVNRLGWNRFEPIKSSNQSNHLIYSIDHPLNICLSRLCQTNENTTVADHSCHKQHALKLIDHDSNIYAMYDYGPSYPFLLAVQTGDKIIVEKILEKASSYIELNIIEPLIYACTRSYYHIVQILVNFGFDPNTIMINREYTKLTNRKISFFFNSLDLIK